MIRKISLGIVLAVWLSLTVFCIIKPQDDFSSAERRQLSKFPEVSVNSVASGKFASEFESYTLDQFPLRDSFRTIKAVTEFDLLGKLDNNDIYIKDGQAAQLLYPLSENSVNNAAEKITSIYETYIEGSDCNVAVVPIPDKGYYLAEKNGYPSLDYGRMFDVLKEKLPFATFCDITDTLDEDSYYPTDTHWKQENLLPTAQKIADIFGVSVYDGEVKTAKEDFYGVYYGQSALPLKADKINYITNDPIENLTAYNYETNETGGVYVSEKLDGRDAYDFFLFGASPLVEIKNPECTTGRELVIFRDSYTSSIAPLLVKDYSRVLLVDTRYMASAFIGQYIDFENQDVLFMYSTSLLNSSYVLK